MAAKTTKEDVLEIRKLYKGGMKICDVARKFNHLSESSVGDIIRRKTWKHVAEVVTKVKTKSAVKKKRTRSTLTDEKALEIRKLHKEGKEIPILMEKYKVSRLVINCIIHRHTFKHI